MDDKMVCYTCGWEGPVSQTDYTPNIGHTCKECGNTVTVEEVLNETHKVVGPVV